MSNEPKILVSRGERGQIPTPLINVLFAQDGSQGRGYSDSTIKRLQLEPNLGVVVCCSAEEVLFRLQPIPGMESVEVLIGDCRLPHGKGFDRVATFDGMLTGVSLYSRIRAMNSDLFIVMFTTQHEELVKLGLETLSDPNLAVVKAEGIMDERIIQLLEARFPTRFTRGEGS